MYEVEWMVYPPSIVRRKRALALARIILSSFPIVPMIPVMIAVGILLLAVLALFIGTSRPNKRRRRRSNNDYSSNHKEETATIMSAKTMHIDLDAGEE